MRTKLHFLLALFLLTTLSCRSMDLRESEQSLLKDEQSQPDGLHPSITYVNRTAESNPKTYTITDVAPKSAQGVSIIFETWGHVYMQVGSMRFDGHLLFDPIDITQNSTEMNRGFAFTFDLGSETELKRVQKIVQEFGGKPGVTCAFEMIKALRKAGYEIGTPNKELVFLNQVYQELLKNGVRDRHGKQLPVELSNAADMKVEKFGSRLARVDQRWVSGLINDVMRVSPKEFQQARVNGFKGFRFSQVPAVRNGGYDPSQLEVMDRVFLDFVETNPKLVNETIDKFPEYLDRARQANIDAVDKMIEIDRTREHMKVKFKDIKTQKGTRRVLFDANHPEAKETFVEDHTRFREMDLNIKTTRESSSKEGHTLGANDYIERHIPKEVLHFLYSNPEIKVDMYSGTRIGTLSDLHRRGFTDIKLLSRNRNTDFDQYVATNPTTKDMVYALRALPGRSYAYEMMYNLLHYAFPRYNKDTYLESERMSLRTSTTSVKASMKETLRKNNVNPDVLFFGYQRFIYNILQERGISPVKQIRTEGVYAAVYEINGVQVMSMGIEPSNFGSRAGAMIEACYEMDPRGRQVMMVGTAGSLNPKYRANEYVVPQVFTQGNSPLSQPLAQTPKNHAKEWFSEAEAKQNKIHVLEQQQHVAVDSILMENQKWMRTYRATSAVVEQEGYDIAKAAQKTGAKLSIMYRISDELYSEKNFNVHEAVLDAELLDRVLRRATTKTVEHAAHDIVHKPHFRRKPISAISQQCDQALDGTTGAMN